LKNNYSQFSKQETYGNLKNILVRKPLSFTFLFIDRIRQYMIQEVFGRLERGKINKYLSKILLLEHKQLVQ